MLDAWLNESDDVLEKSGPPTWKSLQEALLKIGQNGIAAKIKKNGIAAITLLVYFSLTCWCNTLFFDRNTYRSCWNF